MENLSPERRALLALQLRKTRELGVQEKIPRRNESDFAPLSFTQQRLWFLNQLEPGSTAYNITAALRLTGSLNVAALMRNNPPGETRRRHFISADGQTRQVISPVQSVNLFVTDLSSLTETERRAEVQRHISQEAALPFDLAAGPVLRVKLLRLSEDKHVLLVTMHHIISDAWSVGLLIREVGVLYGAFASGAPSPLPELEIQYADYAEWQRTWLRGEVLDAQLAYWKQQLAGAPPILTLPTDRPRPPAQSYRGAHLPFSLNRNLTDQLKQMSSRENVTLFMTLLAAFQVLLGRYSGQRDIVVGTSTANRARTETEGLIGCFINMLALRTRLDGDANWRELLRKVRDVCLGAYAHQEFPFEKLVEELQPARELSYHPVFQVMLVLQNVRLESLELKGINLSRIEIETSTAKFDLTITLRESADCLQGRIEYSTDLFGEPTMRRLAEHYERLLTGMVQAPGQRAVAAALLSESSRSCLRRAIGRPRMSCAMRPELSQP